ncbi:MAG: hypothetical protein EOP04_20020, partial [Proteobacteria bacterium]
LVQFAIPVGIGVRYKLNSRFDISAEFGFRKTFTDYLDDTQHPEMSPQFRDQAVFAPGDSPTPDPKPDPKPTPPLTVQWKCEFKDVPEKVTIGDKIAMVCDGPPARLQAASLRIEMAPNEPPVLYILEVKELKETSASLIVAPWLGGEGKLQNPALTDGTTRIGLGELQLQMTSVMDPKTNPEGKPIPPLHPLALAWPIWLWILASALVCGLLYLVGLAIRQSLRRKRLLTLLEKNSIALSPLNYFNKELRKLQRQIPVPSSSGIDALGKSQGWDQSQSKAFFQVLEKEFRWFLARELIIPAIEGSTGTILRSLRKADRDLSKHVGRDLRIVLTELRKAQAPPASNSEDAVQLVELARSIADSNKE